MSEIELDELIERALKLSVAEQAKLLERVAAHLAKEVDTASTPSPDEDYNLTGEELADLLEPGIPKTGAEIAAMIESGELNTSAWSEMANPHISDPVEWLKALRRDLSKKRNLDWGNE